MNLTKLFETQRILDARIEKEHPRGEGEDRLAKKILALQVELGECANEWRGFKFWSNDQVPTTFERSNCPSCFKKGFFRGNPPVDEIKGIHRLGNHWYDCPDCSGFLVVDKNPLLEEYVDCLHFTLSILLSLDEVGSCSWFKPGKIKHFLRTSLNLHFIELNGLISEIYYKNGLDSRELIYEILALGEGLGFTWEQIEQAYYDKNAINHTRQDTGY